MDSRLIVVKKTKSQGKNTFIIAFVIAFVILIPFLVKDRGIFVMYGDYNVQQIPFYQLAHNAVRSGEVFWNWNTDLGVNFIGSYSFYLLYSPFFWITLAFPNNWLPYLMAPLLMLKTACAAFTAYLYLERFVKDKVYALVGGLLYAFSGWMFFNMFFNHFHEVAVFFPLMLLGLEKLVTEDKKIFFALTVAVNAVVNYWFFVGEVVFIIIYVIVRSYNRDWGITFKRFCRIFAESVLGLLLSMFATLPSVLAIMGNPRASTDRLISGWSFWIYYHNATDNGSYSQRFFAILQSLFFPPDLTARPNFFPNHGAEWSSISAWLPLFGLVGVIAYFIQNKNRPSWLKKLLPLMLVIALIPGFNSLFVGLTNGYYARWFYMPVLMMALATIIALENSKTNTASFRTGIKWVAIICTFFAIAAGLTPHKEDGVWKFGIAKDLGLVWIWFGIVVVGLVIVFVLMKFRSKSWFQQWLIGGLAFITMSFGIIYLNSGRIIYPRSNEVINVALGNQGKWELPSQQFVRSDIYKDSDNLLMYWELPGIQAFHSIVPPSVIEFYTTLGIKRNEASRPSTDDAALRPLLSVGWLLIKEDKEPQDPMPNYALLDQQNGYNVYYNNAFIPMGFAYDHYATRDQLESLPEEQRSSLMLKALVIENDDEKLAQKLEPFPEGELYGIDPANFLEDSMQRKSITVNDFTVMQRGFTATSDFQEDTIIFFSVPYDAGWSALVNGIPVEITKANVGFMAIEVPSGSANITFSYTAPGLKIGIVVSVGIAFFLLIYWLIIRTRQVKKDEKLEMQQGLLISDARTFSWDEYLSRFDPEHREHDLSENELSRKKEQVLKLIEERSKEKEDDPVE